MIVKKQYKYISYLIILLIGVSLAGFFVYAKKKAALEKEVASVLSEGILSFEKNDLDSARKAFDKVLKVNPNNADAMYYLGNVYNKQGLNNEAINIYQSALKIDGSNINIYMNIGNIYLLEKNYDKAKEYYEIVITRDASNDKAYFSLAYVYEITNQLKNAISFYEKAFEVNPKNAEAYYNAGNVYVKLDLKEKALDLYLKAIENNPNYMDAYVNLSILSLEKEDYKGAVQYLDKAIILGYEADPRYLASLEKYREKLEN